MYCQWTDMVGELSSGPDMVATGMVSDSEEHLGPRREMAEVTIHCPEHRIEWISTDTKLSEQTTCENEPPGYLCLINLTFYPMWRVLEMNRLKLTSDIFFQLGWKQRKHCFSLVFRFSVFSSPKFQRLIFWLFNSAVRAFILLPPPQVLILESACQKVKQKWKNFVTCTYKYNMLYTNKLVLY